MEAIRKYMSNNSESSVESIWAVNCGGIKKKPQIKALIAADNITGKISKNIAIIETVTSRINATILYSI